MKPLNPKGPIMSRCKHKKETNTTIETIRTVITLPFVAVVAIPIMLLQN